MRKPDFVAFHFFQTNPKYRGYFQTFTSICLPTLIKSILLPLRKEFHFFSTHFHLNSFIRLKSKISHSLFFISPKALSHSSNSSVKAKKSLKSWGFLSLACACHRQVGGFTVGRRLAPPSDTLALRARAPKTSTRETAE